MNTETININDEALDRSLRLLVQARGYDDVQARLNAIRESGKIRESDKEGKWLAGFPPLTATQIRALPRTEQDRIIAASVEAALPAYEAERTLPPQQRVLTADRETGDGLSDEDEDENA